jgi:hypothetical protein
VETDDPIRRLAEVLVGQLIREYRDEIDMRKLAHEHMRDRGEADAPSGDESKSGIE